MTSKRPVQHRAWAQFARKGKKRKRKNKIGPTVEAQFAINKRKLKIKNK
jgi:hypothetical protein